MLESNDHELKPGLSIGRYEIVRRIGSGGMGAVYEAVHIDLKKRVAIKVLHAMTAQIEEVRTRFVREGEAAARIRHPHVVDIYDVGTESGSVFLVMEYLEGEDLAGQLKRQTKLSVREIADLMLPVCAAVSAAHDEHVVHRDLKPGNIFLSKGRGGVIVPKVLDFGISKILQDEQMKELTLSGTLLGTPHYMSPEQAQGEKDITGLSDLYALGVITYECATGRRAFPDGSMYQLLHNIVIGSFQPPRALCPDLPEAFEQAILRAMATACENRYPNVRAFGQALFPFAGERARAVWLHAYQTGNLPLITDPDSFSMPEDTGTRPEASSPLAEPIGQVSPSTQDKPLSLPTGVVIGVLSRRRKMIAALAIVAALGVVSSEMLLGAQSARAVQTEPISAVAPAEEAVSPDRFTVEMTVNPADATFELDGAPLEQSGGRFERAFLRDGAEHRLRARAAGYESTTVVFKDAPPPDHLELLRRREERGATPLAAKLVAQRASQSAPRRPAREAPKPAPRPAELKDRPKAAPAMGANGAPILR